MDKGKPSDSKAIALMLLAVLLFPVFSAGVVLAQGYSFTLTLAPNPVSLGSNVILSGTLCPNPSSGISTYVYYTRPDGSTVSRSAGHNSQDFCSTGFTVDSYVPDQAGPWSVYAQAYQSGQLLATSNTIKFTVQSNGFSISPPLTTTVFQGISTSEYVDVTSGSTQPYTVALTTSGAPAGVSISFNPNSQNPPFQTLMTISATSSAVTGTFTVTISGSGGGYSASNSFQLTVSPASQAPFDFVLSVEPTTNTVTVGGNLDPAGTVSISVLQGTTQPVTLSLSNLPSYVGTTDLNGMSCTPQCSVSFGITVLSSAPGGTYYLTITGTASGGATHSIPYTLNVTPEPHLYVTIVASSQNVVGGGSISLTASVSSSTGGAPSSLTYSWSDNNCGQLSSMTTNPVTWTAPAVSSQIACSISVTVSSSGYLSGSNSVAISISPSTTTSTTTTTTTSTTATTEVPTYTFTLVSVSPNPVTVNSQVTLSGTLCPSPAGGVDVSLVYTRPDGTIVGRTTVHNAQDFCSTPFTVDSFTPDTPGKWSVNAVASQGGKTSASNTITFQVNAEGFSVIITTQSLGVYQGSSGQVTVSVSSASPSTYAVTLDGTTTAGGVTLIFDSNGQDPPFTSHLTISADSSAPPGNYDVQITGTGGGFSNTATFTLMILQSFSTTTSTPSSTSSTSTSQTSSTSSSSTSVSSSESTQGTAKLSVSGFTFASDSSYVGGWVNLRNPFSSFGNARDYAERIDSSRALLDSDAMNFGSVSFSADITNTGTVPANNVLVFIVFHYRLTFAVCFYYSCGSNYAEVARDDSQGFEVGTISPGQTYHLEGTYLIRFASVIAIVASTGIQTGDFAIIAVPITGGDVTTESLQIGGSNVDTINVNSQQTVGGLDTGEVGISVVQEALGSLTGPISAKINDYASGFASSLGKSINVFHQAGTLLTGETGKVFVAVTSEVTNLVLTLTWPGSSMALQATDPEGRMYYGTTGSNSSVLVVPNPIPGNWTVQLVGVDLAPSGENYSFSSVALTQTPQASPTTSVLGLFPEWMVPYLIGVLFVATGLTIGYAVGRRRRHPSAKMAV